MMISRSEFTPSNVGDGLICARAAEAAEQTRIDYAQDWGRAHGLLPDLPPGPPSQPGHFCPAREGWFWSGSREACPHCKIAAPSLRALDAGPGSEA